jgi:hypothetical protein
MDTCSANGQRQDNHVGNKAEDDRSKNLSTVNVTGRGHET